MIPSAAPHAAQHSPQKLAALSLSHESLASVATLADLAPSDACTISPSVESASQTIDFGASGTGTADLTAGTMHEESGSSSSNGNNNNGASAVSSTVSIASKSASFVEAGTFEPEHHFYPRVLNAQIHPLVGSFFSLGNERIIARYVHLNPQVNEEKLREVLSYKPQFLAWAGCDLFNVTDLNGHRNMIVIETNSCPSGQKSMPLVHDNEEHGGYGVVLDHTFRGLLSQVDRTLGALAVVYDKNPMEATGYAAVMADVMKEPVLLVEYREMDRDPPVKWVDRLMHVRDGEGVWHPVRACFRYVTQKPWNRFPLYSRTVVLNSILSCLAGGRNKMMAARAYEFLNSELAGENAGLEIRVPETIRNVTKNEIPLWVESMGGHAVLKVPYSNAGQGVYTITNKQELDDFMATPHHYDKFIVQSLVGNASWSSNTRSGRFFHVGTIPNRKNHTYVSDLRMMVAGSTNGGGFRPVAIYARRARKPLIRRLEDDPTSSSWEMLGTNLSVKLGQEEAGSGAKWTTETQRLLLMDRKDFNTLGIGIDDLIDAYVQTVLSVIAIDRMCQRLMTSSETTTITDRPLAADESVPSTLPTPIRLEPVSADPKTECLRRVQILDAYERDGRTFVREQVTESQRHFDMQLFEALNPDPALLDEILI